jgi:bifunctional NMN adenylyltransferase/nudix hydrolase
MLKEKEEKYDVGVIVARFQTHELTPGHIDLIESVRARHDRVIVFLGLSPLRNTIDNPLDYRCRKAMLNESYPDIDVFYIDDVPGDDVIWSKNLDAQILKWKNPTQTVVLYGSRDSFLKHYKGKFSVKELEAATRISGTEIRRRVCNNYPPTKDYRAGIIASTAQKFPAVIVTVDAAIINRQEEKVLVIKKVNQKKKRFVGGYVVKDVNLEANARREVTEETEVAVGDPIYIGSSLIDDPRYKGEKDCIMTVFFVVDYMWGSPNVKNEDDLTENIESYHWLRYDEVTLENFEPEHAPLVELFQKFIKTLKPIPPKIENIDVP